MSAPRALRFMLIALLACNCRSNNPSTVGTVSDRLSQPRVTSRPQAGSTARGPSLEAPHSTIADTLARVDGRAISRDRFNELLLAGHGLAVLEQLIALELVKAHAAREQINVSPADLQAEYNRSLEEMASAVVDQDDPDQLRTIGAQVLEDFLREKNLSMAEYQVSLERNAHLRKMVESDVTVSDEEVREAFAGRYGRQAVVRHIVSPDLASAAEIRRQLEAGADFGELARSYSMHRISGAAGGLLPPFTQTDAQVPDLLRQVAFGLQPGETSGVLNMDGQHHVVRLERFLEPADSTLTPSRSMQLRQRLWSQKTREAMQERERRLFDAADIRIQDNALRRQFDRKHRAERSPNR